LASDVSTDRRLVSSIVIDHEIIDGPYMLAVKGKFLLLSDARGNPFIHVFDERTSEHLRSFGQRGEGPGLFSQVPRMLRGNDTSGLLWLHDGNRRRFTAFRVADLDPDSQLTVARILRYDSELFQDLDGDADLLIGLRRKQGGGLVVAQVDSASGAAIELATVPLNDTVIPPNYLASAYFPRLCVAPDHMRFAAVYTYAGRVDIFSSNGSLIAYGRVPFSFQPYLTNNPITRQLGFRGGEPEVRTGYNDCAATKERLYALYDGRLNGRRTDPKPPQQSELHVFDWSGNLLRVFTLDHGGYTLSVPPGDSVLYTISEEAKGYVIRRSRIPAISSPSASRGTNIR
jgi:hypothetical protein